MFVGPLVGSSMNTNFGAAVTCDYIAFVNLGFAAVILIFNCGPYVFSENRNFQAKLAELNREHTDTINDQDVPNIMN